MALVYAWPQKACLLSTTGYYLRATGAWLGVYLGVEHDLWGPIPSRGDILCHDAGVVVRGVTDPRQAEIADA